ncbi:MAG: TlpA family protein disulfide reductase [Deltaproteobacteria bacterium]|nr:TlpA family protein disulfide reductase [Deltaproteobacteria bacterium]
MTALLVPGLIWCGRMPSLAGAAFRMGDAPPDVALSNLRGESFRIPSGFAGKVVVIHFWASWCPTCLGEMMSLESVYREYPRKEVIPCSIGLGEKKETALRYLKNVEISYPVLLDPVSSTRKLYGVAGIPTYFIIDRGGLIRQKILGKADPAGLNRMIRSLL